MDEVKQVLYTCLLQTLGKTNLFNRVNGEAHCFFSNTHLAQGFFCKQAQVAKRGVRVTGLERDIE